MTDLTNRETRMTKAIQELRTCNPEHLYSFISNNHRYFETRELANIIMELLYSLKNCEAIGETDLEDFMLDTAEGLGDIYDIYDV